jgi:hypothetical protein
MEVGAIGFHDESKVKKIKVVKDNAIIKALEKTKEVAPLDYLSYFLLLNSVLCRSSFLIWLSYKNKEMRNIVLI